MSGSIARPRKFRIGTARAQSGGAKLWLKTLIVLGIVMVACPSQAVENVVRNFESVVRVQLDGSLIVTDRIIFAFNNRWDDERFMRRVARAPTSWGNVEIIEVLRDRQPEDWRLVGNHILTSADDDLLNQAAYNYLIRFRVPNQVELGSNLDRLVWDAAGTSVQSNVTHASVTVILPPELDVVSVGIDQDSVPATISAIQVDATGHQTVRFSAITGLSRSSIFRIVLEFRPGQFTAPDPLDRAVWQWLRSNPEFGIGAILLTVGCYGYYLLQGRIRRTKRDLSEKLSPAEVRFLRIGRYDATAMNAAILDLVATGHATLRNEPGGAASVEPAISRRSAPALSGAEARLYKSLFGNSETAVTLSGSADDRLVNGSIALQSFLETRLVRRSPLDRRTWLIGEYCIAIIATLLVAATSAGPAYGLTVAGAYCLWVTISVLFVWFDIALYRAFRRGERSVTIIAGLFAPLITVYAIYQITNWLPWSFELLGIAGPAPLVLAFICSGIALILQRPRLDLQPQDHQKIVELEQQVFKKNPLTGQSDLERYTTVDRLLPYAVALAPRHEPFEAVLDAIRRGSRISQYYLDWRDGNRQDWRIPEVGVALDPSSPRY